MRLPICALIVALALPGLLRAAGLEISPPAEVEFQPGKLVKVSAKADGGSLAFEVSSVPTTPLDVEVLADRVVCGMPPAGTVIVVTVAGLVGGKVVIAKTTVTIKEAVKPPPRPEAAPRKGPVKSITFVHAGASPAADSFRTNSELRTALALRGVVFHTLDVGTASKADPEVVKTFRGFFDAAGGSTLVGQDANDDEFPKGQSLKFAPASGDDWKTIVVAVDQLNGTQK